MVAQLSGDLPAAAPLLAGLSGHGSNRKRIPNCALSRSCQPSRRGGGLCCSESTEGALVIKPRERTQSFIQAASSLGASPSAPARSPTRRANASTPISLAHPRQQTAEGGRGARCGGRRSFRRPLRLSFRRLQQRQPAAREVRRPSMRRSSSSPRSPSPSPGLGRLAKLSPRSPSRGPHPPPAPPFRRRRSLPHISVAAFACAASLTPELLSQKDEAAKTSILSLAGGLTAGAFEVKESGAFGLRSLCDVPSKVSKNSRIRGELKESREEENVEEQI